MYNIQYTFTEPCTVRLIVIKMGKATTTDYYEVHSLCLTLTFVVRYCSLSRSFAHLFCAQPSMRATQNKAKNDRRFFTYAGFTRNLCLGRANKTSFCPLQSTKNVIKHLHIRHC